MQLCWVSRCGTLLNRRAPTPPPQGEPLVAQRGTGGQPDLPCTLLFPAADGAPQKQQGAAASPDASGSFSAQRFAAALDTRVLGRVLLSAASAPSTQVLVQVGEGLLQPLVWVHCQSAAWRRHGKQVWEPGCGTAVAPSCSCTMVQPERGRCRCGCCRRTRPACQMGSSSLRTGSWEAKVGAGWHEARQGGPRRRPCPTCML